MQKRTKALVIGGSVAMALVVGAFIVAPALYRSIFATSEVAAPTLRADETTLQGKSDVPLDPAALTGTWKFVEGSSVGYRVDEQLQGAPVTVVGSSPAVTGEIQADGLTLTAAQISVDVATLETDSPSRDNYFRETTVRASEHPTATFELTEPVTLDSAPTSGQIITQQLTGDLTLAGETVRVNVTVQMRTDGERAEMVGKIPITFANFGIVAPSLGGFVTVEETGLIEFDLVAIRD